LRRALANGFAQVDRRRALLVVDSDEFGGVLRGGQRLGNHDGDRLAHMPHGLAGERGPLRNNELRSAAAGEGRVLGHIAKPSMSAAVSTPSTPGATLAALVSSERISAKACGERTK